MFSEYLTTALTSLFKNAEPASIAIMAKHTKLWQFPVTVFVLHMLGERSGRMTEEPLRLPIITCFVVVLRGSALFVASGIKTIIAMTLLKRVCIITPMVHLSN